MSPLPDVTADAVFAIRLFNRTYTSWLGLLERRLDGSTFALPDARVLYELAHAGAPTAAEIGRALALDAGQLSRIVKHLRDAGLVTHASGPTRGKRRPLTLTEKGREAFARLDEASGAAVASRLGAFSEPQRRALVEAGATMTRVLSGATRPESAVLLRAPRVGDLGWIVHRQAVLYAQEYGWDASFEALIAGILAHWVENHQPAREQAWIAEVDGWIAGSIVLVAAADRDVAKLRLLYVEPAVRGRGVGRALVRACLARAREVGYGSIELWTNSVLTAARRLYEAEGFTLSAEAPHRSFGKDLVGQTWRLDL